MGFEDVLPGDASGDAGREGDHLAPARDPIKYFNKKERKKPARGPIKCANTNFSFVSHQSPNHTTPAAKKHGFLDCIFVLPPVFQRCPPLAIRRGNDFCCEIKTLLKNSVPEVANNALDLLHSPQPRIKVDIGRLEHSLASEDVTPEVLPPFHQRCVRYVQPFEPVPTSIGKGYEAGGCRDFVNLFDFNLVPIALEGIHLAVNGNIDVVGSFKTSVVVVD